MVGLTAAQHRPVREYSKGMQRRIGLAQALINDPDFLILDEPTTGLDPIGTRQVKDLIIELGRRGKTVLLSSHLAFRCRRCCRPDGHPLRRQDPRRGHDRVDAHQALKDHHRGRRARRRDARRDRRGHPQALRRQPSRCSQSPTRGRSSKRSSSRSSRPPSKSVSRLPAQLATAQPRRSLLRVQLLRLQVLLCRRRRADRQARDVRRARSRPSPFRSKAAAAPVETGPTEEEQAKSVLDELIAPEEPPATPEPAEPTSAAKTDAELC